ncbi:MAG: cytochrome-c oxidase, cbb3-type subunit II [Candidatus Jidaibacter sp.]|jgi:cytochrome c oxidase cbb3-type subunit 2|nr:cytochrome-c oxidase, cbb3-type subunit II [Candidatus Jidaibacter sp.]
MFSEHHKLEKNLFLLLVFMVIVSSIGAIVEIFPLFIKEVAIEKVEGMRPHTPLELAGMEIYKREGCYGCHSQQIRALRDEVERYGHYSLAAESMYDHPFLWGSKRTGPDLARVGGKYSDEWHVQHLIAPRSLVPESIMPNYKFLADAKLDLSDMQKRLKVLRFLGVPYSDQDIEEFQKDIKIQLGMITGQDDITSFSKRYPKTVIRKFNAKSEEITEMDALVAYMQALGNKVDLKTNRGRDW